LIEISASVEITPREYRRVPQIWLTYSEFAAFMNCDPAEARKASIAARLDRRRSRDGQTRIKLSPPLTTVFLDTLMRQFLERQMTACASDLHALHEVMRRMPQPEVRLRVPAA
jgi:hypothetical protein